MTLDELALSIGSASSEAAVQQLASLLLSWKNDDTTVQTLREQVERFIGSIWIESDEVHKVVYAAWSAFAAEAIASVNGMTMNERLYVFGLEQQFAQASANEQRSRLYAKLLAKP